VCLIGPRLEASALKKSECTFEALRHSRAEEDEYASLVPMASSFPAVRLDLFLLRSKNR